MSFVLYPFLMEFSKILHSLLGIFNYSKARSLLEHFQDLLLNHEKGDKYIEEYIVLRFPLA